MALIAANSDNLKRLGNSGACEAIVFALKKHWVHDKLVERACRTAGRLALNSGNSAWLGSAGAQIFFMYCIASECLCFSFRSM